MVYDIYVDGSYKDFGGKLGAFYSGAVTITREGESEPETILTKVSNDDWLSMRNVAGELVAVMMAFEHCLNVLKLTQEDTVRLYYDYAGIENWCRPNTDPKRWRCKNKTTQAYRDYVNTIVRPRFRVLFEHVRGHSGREGNELVDELAKAAMLKHVQDKMIGAGNS